MYYITTSASGKNLICMHSKTTTKYKAGYGMIQETKKRFIGNLGKVILEKALEKAVERIKKKDGIIIDPDQIRADDISETFVANKAKAKIDHTLVPFGRDTGKSLSEISNKDLKWLHNNCPHSQYKKLHENIVAELHKRGLKTRQEEVTESERLTEKHWPFLVEMSAAFKKARMYGSDWEINFCSDLIKKVVGQQVGWFQSAYKYKNYRDAKKLWNTNVYGSFPSLKEEPKGLSVLSEKQLEIFKRITEK